jgi:halocyanin-like protein
MAVGRRSFIRGAAGGAALAATGVATAQEEPDYGGWFSNVGNYDGTTVDRRGEDSIEIAVGAEGNGGNFAFDPPAVIVNPGTEILWHWTGQGSTHNVVSDGDGPLDSGDAVQAEGTTYSYTFEETGIFKYLCEPHASLGMKGAVVVREGEPAGGEGSDGGTPQGPPANPDYEDFFSNVDNFDGTTVDWTDRDSVEIAVGAEGNGGNFAFDPPAVRVTPGTEVTWRWTGQGSTHNVVSTSGGPLDSGDAVQEAGTTYSYTFEEMGVYTYYCEPHESLGMKGAVVVGGPLGGEGAGQDGATQPTITAPGWISSSAVLLAFLSPLLFAVVMKRRYTEQPPVEAFERAEGRTTSDGPAPVEEAAETEPAIEVGHDDYDPWGTAALVAFYFVLIALLWVFMYFVEFLGRVTVMG